MSWYIFAFVVLIVSLLLISRFFTPKYSQRVSIIKELKQLDFNDGKASAYKFTALARELELSDREKRLFEDIFEMLKEYKYRPTTKKLDRNVIARIEIFIQSVE